jgi:hypothetical protein
MTFLITYAFCLLADACLSLPIQCRNVTETQDADSSIIVSPNLLQITM